MDLSRTYYKLPAYQALRICERWGQTPTWLDEQDPGMQSLLMAYETVRGAEE